MEDFKNFFEREEYNFTLAPEIVERTSVEILGGEEIKPHIRYYAVISCRE